MKLNRTEYIITKQTENILKCPGTIMHPLPPLGSYLATLDGEKPSSPDTWCIAQEEKKISPHNLI